MQLGCSRSAPVTQRSCLLPGPQPAEGYESDFKKQHPSFKYLACLSQKPVLFRAQSAAGKVLIIIGATADDVLI